MAKPARIVKGGPKGRPKVRPELKKAHVITYRITGNQYSLLEQRAGDCDGMSINEYARQMSLMDPAGAPQRPRKATERQEQRREAINKLAELGTQLSWAGNNMNQVAMILNSTGDPFHKKAQDLEVFVRDFALLKDQIETAICDIAGYKRDR